MANVKLRIEITADDFLESLGEISTDNMELANTSIKPNASGVFSAFPNNNNATSGLNTLTYGQELCFNDKDELDNIDGFGAGLDDEKNPVEVVWGIVNEDKTYNVTIKFTDAIDLKSVVIYGDNASQQFPTRAILDAGTEFEKEIFSDDYAWSIEFDEPSNSHTIEFTHWNRANYNAVLTLIDVMLQNYEVDIYNGLKSVESLSQSSGDTTGIFYGSIESSGSAEILDRNGELGDLLSDGIIDNSNVPITILVNGKEVQRHISTDSSYNRNAKVLSLEFGNRLNTLDILKYKGYDYPDHSETLANLLFDVLSNLRYALFGKDKQLTEEEFKEMLSNRYDESMTLYDYISLIQIQYPVIESGKTYREILDEFCLIAQMQMYIDDNNNVRFVTARPKEFNEDFTAIRIPKTNMFSQLDYAVLLKNKYDGVEASKTQVNDLTDYDTVVYPAEIDLSTISESNFEKTTKDNQQIEQRSQFISSATFYYEIASYILSNYYYYTGTITIPKNSENNLSKITSINDSLFRTNDFSYRLTYKKYTGSVNADSVWDRGDNRISVSNIVYGNESFDDQVSEEGLVKDESKYTTTLPDSVSHTSTTTTTPNAPNILFTDDENNYYVTYTICVQKKITKLGGYGRWTAASTSSIDIPLSGYFENYIPLLLEFSVYGNKRTISFEQVQSNTPNIETAKTKVSLNSSTLIQTDAVIDTIKNNILADYKQGVSNASVSISCNDYFDSNGKKLIDWAKGEIPQVNQIVYFDNDIYKDQTQRYWKIKGRNFRKTGVPMVDLELEECKTDSVGKLAGMYNENGFTSWSNLISQNYIGVNNNSLTRGENYEQLSGELIIPNSITAIGSHALNFTNLSVITLPNKLTYISEYALAFNTNLKSITIPRTVNVIGIRAFVICDNLNHIIFENKEGWYLSGFYGSYVPEYLREYIDVSDSIQNAINCKDYEIWADEYIKNDK